MIKDCFKILTVICFFISCGKGNEPAQPPLTPIYPVAAKSVTINVAAFDNINYGINTLPVIKVAFTQPLQRSSVTAAVRLADASGTAVVISSSFQNGDSTLLIQPAGPLNYLTKYNLKISDALRSVSNGPLNNAIDKSFITQIDSAAKFPLLTDNALLDLVQKQTFKYFWDFGHPVSGLARERSNGDDNVVTTGGSGFGIMSVITAVSRNFITRTEGLARIQTMTGFLKNTAQNFKGAFPHWMNGATGAVIPFSPKDDGADLVETSYLVQGLLCARQYFSGTSAAEINLRADINIICNRVEWDWFRKNKEDVLYWHWSPANNWDINQKIQGWNECLVTYVLGASSTTHNIPAAVYNNGWAGNGTNGFKNGNSYYGYVLPLGPPAGGPLFFSHYSFLGINPNGLKDAYADYATQTKNHTLINYGYCIANPNNYYGYSNLCWGLTASDVPNGYNANSPTSDVGVISPTAALSSFPYTPEESMKALKFFYYTLGDKIFKDYGFVDAFALKDLWYAESFLAIDQGPIIVMIENYRSGLLWNLFTSCPEVKVGMRSLGFTASYL
ncbi:MAG: glucoamylase family protein [Ferruginibacter sp.]